MASSVGRYYGADIAGPSRVLRMLKKKRFARSVCAWLVRCRPCVHATSPASPLRTGSRLTISPMRFETASKGEVLAFLQARARGNCMSRSITDMIADAVVRLFSEESLCYTGQALILGGGLTAARPGAETNNKQGPEFEV